MKTHESLGVSAPLVVARPFEIWKALKYVSLPYLSIGHILLHIHPTHFFSLSTKGKRINVGRGKITLWLHNTNGALFSPRN